MIFFFLTTAHRHTLLLAHTHLLAHGQGGQRGAPVQSVSTRCLNMIAAYPKAEHTHTHIDTHTHLLLLLLLCISNGPPCALGPGHPVSEAQSILRLNSTAAFQSGAQRWKYIPQLRFGEQLSSAEPFSRVHVTPSSHLGATSHSPPSGHAGRCACPLSVITVLLLKFRWLLGKHVFCLSCRVGDA